MYDHTAEPSVTPSTTPKPGSAQATVWTGILKLWNRATQVKQREGEVEFEGSKLSWPDLQDVQDSLGKLHADNLAEAGASGTEFGRVINEIQRIAAGVQNGISAEGIARDVGVGVDYVREVQRLIERDPQGVAQQGAVVKFIDFADRATKHREGAAWEDTKITGTDPREIHETQRSYDPPDKRQEGRSAEELEEAETAASEGALEGLVERAPVEMGSASGRASRNAVYRVLELALEAMEANPKLWKTNEKGELIDARILKLINLIEKHAASEWTDEAARQANSAMTTIRSAVANNTDVPTTGLNTRYKGEGGLKRLGAQEWFTKRVELTEEQKAAHLKRLAAKPGEAGPSTYATTARLDAEIAKIVRINEAKIDAINKRIKDSAGTAREELTQQRSSLIVTRQELQKAQVAAREFVDMIRKERARMRVAPLGTGGSGKVTSTRKVIGTLVSVKTGVTRTTKVALQKTTVMYTAAERRLIAAKDKLDEAKLRLANALGVENLPASIKTEMQHKFAPTTKTKKAVDEAAKKAAAQTEATIQPLPVEVKLSTPPKGGEYVLKTDKFEIVSKLDEDLSHIGEQKITDVQGGGVELHMGGPKGRTRHLISIGDFITILQNPREGYTILNARVSTKFTNAAVARKTAELLRSIDTGKALKDIGKLTEVEQAYETLAQLVDIQGASVVWLDHLNALGERTAQLSRDLIDQSGVKTEGE